MSRLDEIAKRSEGLTNLCPEYLRAGIRHLQRNCDMDCSVHDEDWEACEQPDRYDGERIAKALADIPWLLDEVERLKPRTITTAEELEELPWGTVILVNPKNGSYPYACQKFVGKWYPVGTSFYHTADSLLVDGKEFTVLHVGSQS